jgi:ATP-dependent Clp protease ATP-binding subunit ClpA
MSIAAKKHLTETGYESDYGARPLKRAIAKKIISGEMFLANTVKVGVKNGISILEILRELPENKSEDVPLSSK